MIGILTVTVMIGAGILAIIIHWIIKLWPHKDAAFYDDDGQEIKYI